MRSDVFLVVIGDSGNRGRVELECHGHGAVGIVLVFHEGVGIAAVYVEEGPSAHAFFGKGLVGFVFKVFGSLLGSCKRGEVGTLPCERHKSVGRACRKLCCHGEGRLHKGHGGGSLVVGGKHIGRPQEHGLEFERAFVKQARGTHGGDGHSLVGLNSGDIHRGHSLRAAEELYLGSYGFESAAVFHLGRKKDVFAHIHALRGGEARDGEVAVDEIADADAVDGHTPGLGVGVVDSAHTDFHLHIGGAGGIFLKLEAVESPVVGRLGFQVDGLHHEEVAAVLGHEHIERAALALIIEFKDGVFEAREGKLGREEAEGSVFFRRDEDEESVVAVLRIEIHGVGAFVVDVGLEFVVVIHERHDVGRGSGVHAPLLLLGGFGEAFAPGELIGIAHAEDARAGLKGIVEVHGSGRYLVGHKVLACDVVVVYGDGGLLSLGNGGVVDRAESIKYIVGEALGVYPSAMLADFAHGRPREGDVAEIRAKGGYDVGHGQRGVGAGPYAGESGALARSLVSVGYGLYAVVAMVGKSGLEVKFRAGGHVLKCVGLLVVCEDFDCEALFNRVALDIERGGYVVAGGLQRTLLTGSVGEGACGSRVEAGSGDFDAEIADRGIARLGTLREAMYAEVVVALFRDAEIGIEGLKGLVCIGDEREGCLCHGIDGGALAKLDFYLVFLAAGEGASAVNGDAVLLARLEMHGRRPHPVVGSGYRCVGGLHAHGVARESAYFPGLGVEIGVGEAVELRCVVVFSEEVYKRHVLGVFGRVGRGIQRLRGLCGGTFEMRDIRNTLHGRCKSTLWERRPRHSRRSKQKCEADDLFFHTYRKLK